MQNRYVGDVGDFAKYALLRRLAGTSQERSIRLGIVWCLYPDESHNADGRHISYLDRPGFAPLDLELISALQEIVGSHRRSIAAIANAGIFPRETIFCDALTCLPQSTPAARYDRLVHRSIWLEDCLARTEASELIFVDPDNGIEVASVPKHHVKAGKYIYWDELALFWRRGHALLIYHHLNRTMPTAAQVEQMTKRLRAELSGAIVMPLVFHRGSCRVFWLVFRRSALGHELKLRVNSFLSSGWKMHFQTSD
jgi:hypothetical protein